MPDEILLVAGRVLLGGLFLAAGLRHLTIVDALAGVLAAKRVPMPRASLIAASLFEAVCGALVVFGVFVELAAVGLILFTIVATLVMLDFWNQQGDMRAASISAWMTNAAIIGGLLIAIATV